MLHSNVFLRLRHIFSGRLCVGVSRIPITTWQSGDEAPNITSCFMDNDYCRELLTQLCNIYLVLYKLSVSLMWACQSCKHPGFFRGHVCRVMCCFWSPPRPRHWSGERLATKASVSPFVHWSSRRFLCSLTSVSRRKLMLKPCRVNWCSKRKPV